MIVTLQKVIMLFSRQDILKLNFTLDGTTGIRRLLSMHGIIKGSAELPHLWYLKGMFPFILVSLCPECWVLLGQFCLHLPDFERGGNSVHRTRRQDSFF